MLDLAENEANTNELDYYGCPSCTVILDCPVCKKKYQMPRILPCGYVVCTTCLLAVMKPINNFQFKCLLCTEVHDNPTQGFPICKQFQSLLQSNQKPQSSSSDTLQKQLKDVKKKIKHLNDVVANGVDKVIAHCSKVRNEVTSSTKMAINYIKDLNDAMLAQIDQYEQDCLDAYQVNKFDDTEFNRLLVEMSTFTEEWDIYFEKIKDENNYDLTDDQLSLAVDLAVELKKKSNTIEKKYDEFLFNKKMIQFDKNHKKIQKDFIGTIKFQPVGPICYEDLKKVNVDNLIYDAIPITIDISLDGDTFYILYQTVGKHLKCITTNKEKTLVTSYNTNKPIIKFIKYKDIILVNYVGGNGNHYILQLLNLRLQNLYQIDIHNALGFNCNYRAHFLSANDSKIYYYSLCSRNRSSSYQLRVFNRQLQFIKAIGQSTNPNEPFYFSFTIKQFEARNGKFFWLDEKYFVIMNETTGVILKWIQINSDKFLIDTCNNFTLLNKTTRELVYFDNDGVLLNQIAVCEFNTDPIIFLDNNDKLMLYDSEKFLILSSKHNK